MKENKLQELLLRYLDNDLSESEVNYIKKLLDEDKNALSLYQQLRETANRLNEVRETDIDPTYYSTIIPRLRLKLEKKKRIMTIERVGFVFTTLLLVMFYFIGKNSGKISMKDIADDTGAINTFLFSNNSTGILYELNQDGYANEYIDEVINEELGVTIKSDEEGAKTIQDTKEIEEVPDEEIELFLLGLTEENLL